MMRKDRVAALTAALLLAGGLVLLEGGPPVARADDTLAECRAMWQEERYSDAAPKLIQYRYEGAYGRTPEVDYMIATSLCRIPGHEEKGRRFFLWILANYSLDPASRALVVEEMGACEAGTPPVVVGAFPTQRAGSGVVGVRGKTFYWLDAENAPLGSAPVTTVREVSAEELASRRFARGRAPEAVAFVRKLVGTGFRVVGSGRFVLASASGHGTGELERIGGELERVFAFYRDAFGVVEPAQLITVYLVPDPYLLRHLAVRLHGLKVPESSIGYSYRDDMSMVGVIPGSYTGTLRHELFHLLVRNNFGDIPPWMDEGIAALYEVSRIDGDRVVGMPNWRGPVLERFWQGRPTVAELLRMDWRSFDEPEGGGFAETQAVHHAMARYFALYLQETGRLATVYDAFRSRKVEDTALDPGADAVRWLEEATDSTAAALDSEFVTWFRAQQAEIESARRERRSLIRRVQKGLVDRGYDPGEVDGFLGPNTEEALRRFQRDRGLTTTGVLDAATLKLLEL